MTCFLVVVALVVVGHLSTTVPFYYLFIFDLTEISLNIINGWHWPLTSPLKKFLPHAES